MARGSKCDDVTSTLLVGFCVVEFDLYLIDFAGFREVDRFPVPILKGDIVPLDSMITLCLLEADTCVVGLPELPASTEEEILKGENTPCKGSIRGGLEFLIAAEQHTGSARLHRLWVVLIPVISGLDENEGCSREVQDGVPVMPMRPFDSRFLIFVSGVLITFLVFIVAE